MWQCPLSSKNSIVGVRKGRLMANRRRTRNGKEALAPRHLADTRQGAILVLRSIELRDAARDKPMTRVQFTVPMLKRLWNRPRLTPEFIQEVTTWLAVAGWCFFDAGPAYAAIRIRAVKNWPRLGTKAIADELAAVARGDFPFEDHEHLLIGRADGGATDDD